MPYMSGVVTIPVAELESLKRERDNAVLDARKCRVRLFTFKESVEFTM